MDNLRWYLGKTLKRLVEQSGRSPHLDEYLVAAWLQAQADGVTLDDAILKLQEVAAYEPPAIDRTSHIRELGF